MPKLSPKRTTFKNKHPNANTIAVEERKSRTEKLNNVLKVYLKYYDSKIENKELHEILDRLFERIQLTLDPDEENPGEDLYEYIEELTEYVDDNIDSRNDESKDKLRQFSRVRPIIREYSKQILHAVRNNKKAHALMKHMNNDDAMGNITSAMKRSTIRGGTRKLRKH